MRRWSCGAGSGSSLLIESAEQEENSNGPSSKKQSHQKNSPRHLPLTVPFSLSDQGRYVHHFTFTFSGADRVGKSSLIRMIQQLSINMALSEGSETNATQSSHHEHAPSKKHSPFPPLDPHAIHLQWILPPLGHKGHHWRRSQCPILPGAFGNVTSNPPSVRIVLTLKEPGEEAKIRSHFTSSSFRSTDVHFLLHDLTRKETLVSLEDHWRCGLAYSPNALRVLIGTKVDQQSSPRHMGDIQHFFQRIGGTFQKNLCVVHDDIWPLGNPQQLLELHDLINAIVIWLLTHQQKPNEWLEEERKNLQTQKSSIPRSRSVHEMGSNLRTSSLQHDRPPDVEPSTLKIRSNSHDPPSSSTKPGSSLLKKFLSFFSPKN